MKTPQGNPALVILRINPSRACGDGVPGSNVACSTGSINASDTPTPTGTAAAAAVSNGMSRESTVPLVRMENGVPLSAKASITPGISRYRPSARWYGSVLVPIATCSRSHRGRNTSFRNISPILVFTTIWLSKSAPASNSRYSWVRRAKQYRQACEHPR